MPTPSGNFTGLTPRAAQALADTVKAVRRLPTDSRMTPNTFRFGGGSPLPKGTGIYKVLMLLDNTSNPAIGWDYPSFHS